MADRERLSVQRLATELPIMHLAIGLATLAYVVRRRPVEGDASPTYSIADRMGQGLIPYIDFPVEYPPLALPHLYLPRLIAGTSWNLYEWVFTFLSIGVALATAVVVYWLARRGWSLNSVSNTVLIFMSLVFAGVPLVIWRFDITSTLFSAIALAAFAAGRDGWTGVALGLGTLTKLYPAFLGPVFFGARLFERRWQSALAMVVAAAVTVGSVFVGLYLFAGREGFSFLLYQADRGVEIESLAGGLALLAHAYGIEAARIFFGFGAAQVESPVIGQSALLLTVFNWAIVLAVIGTAAWRFRADVRATGSVAPQTVVAYLVATLLVVILTNKVLSPQYLVWLMPFAALMPRRQSLLLVVITALTTLIYPMGWQTLMSAHQSTVVALNVRNLLLVVLLVWVIWPPRERGTASESGDVRDAANHPRADPEYQ